MTKLWLACEQREEEVFSMKFTNVTADAKANVYFDGKVVSHGVTLEDGSTKTFGLIFPGKYHFDTNLAECMEITDGVCAVSLDGIEGCNSFAAGDHFDVDANSGFSIEVTEGICQYICSFID